MGDKLEEQRQKILAKHPLQVIMTLRFKGNRNTWYFSFLCHLHVFCFYCDMILLLSWVIIILSPPPPPKKKKSSSYE